MEAVTVGRPLFYSGKEERMSAGHCAFRLRTDKLSPPLVALSDISRRKGVCIHISVTDVIHKAFMLSKATRICAAVAGLSLKDS